MSDGLERVIADLDAARANGTLRTYGAIQKRLRNASSQEAEAKADAWDEGRSAGMGGALDPLNGASTVTNPYRKDDGDSP